MSELSVQSDAFLLLYKKLRPTLERTQNERLGPQRAMTIEMPAFFPRDVMDALDQVRTIAAQGIAAFGPSVTQVVLTGRQMEMIRWAIEKSSAAT